MVSIDKYRIPLCKALRAFLSKVVNTACNTAVTHLEPLYYSIRSQLRNSRVFRVLLLFLVFLLFLCLLLADCLNLFLLVSFRHKAGAAHTICAFAYREHPFRGIISVYL